MKTLIFFLPLILLFFLFLDGCGSNNPVTNPQNNTDTSFVNYIIITPASGPSDTLHFTNRNQVTGSYSSSTNDTYCLLNDTVSSQSVSFTFNGNTAGSPAFTFGFLSYMSGSYSASAISGTVTLYETVGGKIKGTFSGTFTGGSASYQGRGEFTVFRTH